MRLVRAVARATAPGTPDARARAGSGWPFLLATLVANMTGNNLVGMISVAQLAVFCAFLVLGARNRAPARKRGRAPSSVNVLALVSLSRWPSACTRYRIGQFVAPLAAQECA